MALSDAKLKAVKPKEKPYRLADKDSLYVQISPAGGASWRFNFMFAGKQKTLALGQWPAVSIKEARRRLQVAKGQLSEGVDPAAVKQARKRPAASSSAPTFEEAARAWHAAQIPRWTEDYGKQVLTRLEADVFPDLGAKRFPIPRGDILACLRLVEARGVLETVRRLRQYVGCIHRFAGAENESITDPTPMLKGALQVPKKGRHHKRLQFDRMGAFLRKLDTYETEYDGEAVTRLAIGFTVLTASRTCETINAEWLQFSDWRRASVDALWRVPENIMKMGDPHMVPLSMQAVELLGELQELTGQRKYLFPQPFGRERPMSNNAMLFACYRMGYRGRATMHGMRSVFSTWANENCTKYGNLWNADDVELCLAHDERDESRGAYNAAKRLHERRVLLQAWADALDDVKRDVGSLVG